MSRRQKDEYGAPCSIFLVTADAVRRDTTNHQTPRPFIR
jgi:hypothetical protein